MRKARQKLCVLGVVNGAGMYLTHKVVKKCKCSVAKPRRGEMLVVEWN